MLAREAAPQQHERSPASPAPAGPRRGHDAQAVDAPGASSRAPAATARVDALGGVLARAVGRRARAATPAGALLQRLVYVEGSPKAPAVPQAAKSHAKWCIARQSWLDANAVDLQIGLRTVKAYTKFKATWVGHMVYNNEPDPNKAKRPNETDDEYDNRRRTKLPTSGDYREYDIQAYVPGARGTDRVIVDRTSKRAWYTGDHYANLVEMKL